MGRASTTQSERIQEVRSGPDRPVAKEDLLDTRNCPDRGGIELCLQRDRVLRGSTIPRERQRDIRSIVTRLNISGRETGAKHQAIGGRGRIMLLDTDIAVATIEDEAVTSVAADKDFSNTLAVQRL